MNCCFKHCFCAVAVLAGLAFVVWVLTPPEEWTLPGELRWSQPEIDPADDAYPHFVAAAGALPRPLPERKTLLEFIFEDTEDTEAVRAALDSSAAALALAERGLTCNGYAPPAPISHGDPGLPAEEFWTIVMLWTAKSRMARLDGDGAASLDAILRAVRFASYLVHSPSDIIEAICSQRTLGTALAGARAAVLAPQCGETELAALANGLAGVPDLRRAVVVATRGEFARILGTLREGESSREAPFATLDSDPANWRRVVQWKLRPLFYKPRETRRMLAEASMQAITNALLPMAQCTFGEPSASSPNDQLLGSNAVGEEMCQFILFDGKVLQVHLCRAESNVLATRLVVALRRYHLRHGTWPARLDELVPEWLPAVPLDPFDAQPFRYDPERGIVYAVGVNLVDDGGVTQPPGPGSTPLPPQPRRPVLDEVYRFRAP